MDAISVFQSPFDWKSHRPLIQLLLLYVFLSLMECVHASNSAQMSNGILRMDLVHIDSLLPPNITSTERLKRAVQRSRERHASLQVRSANTEKSGGYNQLSYAGTTLIGGSGEFLIHMAIGSPVQYFDGVLDTGSDLMWTQCKPCDDCYPQPTPIYDPYQSSTYSSAPCKSDSCNGDGIFCGVNGICQYNLQYGDNGTSQGIIAYETFTFSAEFALSFPHVAFGCGHINKGISFQGGGVVGFGRGPLSLPSQLAPSLGNVFSYCLVSVTDPPSQTGPLFIGNVTLFNHQIASSTPIIRNGKYPSFYYLSLLSISVDGQVLDIAAGTFDIKSDSSGGFIIDSGTTVTYLSPSAYDFVKNALKSLIDLPLADGSKVGLDLCWSLGGSATPSFPTVTFHFKGADWNLPRDNYLISMGNNVICLAMLPNFGDGDVSMFGNVQQQNYQILYDNVNNVLSFAPTPCDSA